MDRLPSFNDQLIYAITAEPKKTNMWVRSVGNPNANHQQLIELYTLFMHICDQHQIKAWLLFGSLIGYFRHSGIIPWEWDMDVGVSSDDYKKLEKLRTEYVDDEWEFACYEDPANIDYQGYPGESYCFRNKMNKTVLVDICEYKESEGFLIPVTPEGYSDYDSYKIEDIYPLKRTTLLGFGTWIPHNPAAIFQYYGDISWYDPVPFILTKLYNHKYCELFCTPATKKINKADSLHEGIEKYAKQGLPFYVQNLENINLNLHEIDAKLIGWDDEGKIVENVDSREAVKLWLEGKLKINFVDSPLPGLSSLENCELRKYVNPDSLMFVLSNNLQYTSFHIDPIIDYIDEENKFHIGGGVWMYIHKGQKLWQTLSPEYTKYLFNPNENKINDLKMSDLLYLSDHALWGKIEEVYLNAGDFIYLPPGYLHRVWTYESSFGLGGYMNIEGDEPYKKQALKYLTNLNINVTNYPGLWF